MGIFKAKLAQLFAISIVSLTQIVHAQNSQSLPQVELSPDFGNFDGTSIIPVAFAWTPIVTFPCDHSLGVMWVLSRLCISKFEM